MGLGVRSAASCGARSFLSFGESSDPCNGDELFPCHAMASSLSGSRGQVDGAGIAMPSARKTVAVKHLRHLACAMRYDACSFYLPLGSLISHS